MFRLLIMLSFLSCISPVLSQTKPRPLPEPCQVSQPPTFRGFHLKQTPKQIEELIPGFQEAYDEAAPDSMGKGQVIVSSTSLFKDDNRKPPYEDVDFIWHFFEGELFYLIVKYNKFEPANLQDFLRQAAPKLNLPLTGWTLTDKFHATLTCVGFKIELWTGDGPVGSFQKDFASAMLTDSAAEAQLNRHLKVEEQKQKQLEQERMRKELERKRIFNP